MAACQSRRLMMSCLTTRARPAKTPHRLHDEPTPTLLPPQPKLAASEAKFRCSQCGHQHNGFYTGRVECEAADCTHVFNLTLPKVMFTSSACQLKQKNGTGLALCKNPDHKQEMLVHPHCTRNVVALRASSSSTLGITASMPKV